MEELIRWIFIIIIIFSFLKGLFPKKPTGDKKPGPVKRNPDYDIFTSGPTVPQSERREAELTLEDILARIPGQSPGTSKETSSTSSGYEKYSENKTFESTGYGQYSENNPFDSPVDYDLGIAKMKEKVSLIQAKTKSDYAKKKKELSDLKPLLKTEIHEKKESEIMLSLRKKFQQPETLRELYVVSEILGKPKAFRRW